MKILLLGWLQIGEQQPQQPHIDRSEGDVNLSPARAAWQAEHIDAKTRDLLDRDAAVFLHQSLSSPCLNALQSCGGIYLEDTQGRRIMDFHGNRCGCGGQGGVCRACTVVTLVHTHTQRPPSWLLQPRCH